MTGALLIAPAAAQASSAVATKRDQASTTKFIAAVGRFYKAEQDDLGKARTATGAFVTSVSSSCPGLLPATDAQLTVAQSQVYLAVLVETGADLSAVQLKPEARAFEAQERVFAGLRWSRTSIDRAIHELVLGGRAQLALKPTRLCADIRTAVDSGFATLAPASATLLDALDRLGSTRSETLAQLLKSMKPYTVPAEKATIKRLLALETKLGREFGAALNSAAKRLATALVATASPAG